MYLHLRQTEGKMEAKLLKESPKNKCTLACATGEQNSG